MTKKYHKYTYNIPVCALRVIVLGPFALTSYIVDKLNDLLKNVTWFISDRLPNPSTAEYVEWEQLSKRQQKKVLKDEQKIKEIRDRVKYQTQKVDT